jgi:amino acid transporter
MTDPVASAASTASTGSEHRGGLRRDTLGLPHAVVISVAVMSPAASIFYNTIPQAGLVGAAIPLCYAIGFVVALIVANQYSELSRELPSSGSAYTFVTEGLGRRWGFMTAWIGLAALGIGVPYSFVLMSASLETLIHRWAGINLPWPAYFVLAIALVFALCYWGIRQSLRVDLAFLAFELAACVAFAGVVLFRVGSGPGLSAEPFTTAGVPQNGDLIIGIVLAVLSFIGFETAATLGEETRDPHRNIPRAVYSSMIVVGIFYVLLAYSLTIGYGLPHIVTGYANDPAPFDTIAQRIGGSGVAAVIDLVAVASFFSAAIAIVNGGARLLFAASRDGALPPWLSWTHPVRHTPAAGVALLCILGLVLGISLGALFTPIVAFGFFGTIDAIFVLLIYVLVSAACIRFFWRKRRAQFSILRHGVVPALGFLITAAIVAAASASPGPAPLAYIPLVVAGWVVLGLIILLVTRGKLA